MLRSPTVDLRLLHGLLERLCSEDAPIIAPAFINFFSSSPRANALSSGAANQLEISWGSLYFRAAVSKDYLVEMLIFPPVGFSGARAQAVGAEERRSAVGQD